METILGANGVIGRELSLALADEGRTVRQVSRNPRRVNVGDEVAPADLLDPRATADAVAESDTAYLVVGLEYDTATWKRDWPQIMRNTIDACKRHRTALVFLDNVYPYGRVEGWMTEQTPFAPSTSKGEVRARVATMLLDEMRAGELRAMIVRSADFYGPGAVTSLLHSTVFERLRQGRSPQWIGDPEAVHTFTYTPDVGRALAVLGRSPDAFGQTWHAPTVREEMNGETFVRLACEAAGRPYHLQVAPRWMLRLMGLFVPVLRENEEMMYQFEEDYRFDSSKIESALGLLPTPYSEGVPATVSAAEAGADAGS